MPMQGKCCLCITDKERGSERRSKLPDATQPKLMAEVGLSPSLFDPKAYVFPIILITSEICKLFRYDF